MDENIWTGKSADFSLVPATTAWPCLTHALFLFTNRKMHEAVLRKGQQAKFTIALEHNVKQPFSPKIELMITVGRWRQDSKARSKTYQKHNGIYRKWDQDKIATWWTQQWHRLCGWSWHGFQQNLFIYLFHFRRHIHYKQRLFCASSQTSYIKTWMKGHIRSTYLLIKPATSHTHSISVGALLLP